MECRSKAGAPVRVIAMSPLRFTVIGVILALTLDEGCKPAAPARDTSMPLYIPPLSTSALVSDPLVVRFAEGAPAPSGCFAQSRKTGRVACLVGRYSLRNDTGERRLTQLSNSDDGVPDVPVRVVLTESGVRLAPQSRRMLDALMREGDFVKLGASTILPSDSPRSFGGLRIELHRWEYAPHEVLAPEGTSDLKITVRPEASGLEDPAQAQAPESGILFENTLSAVACIDPSLTVRLLDPTVVLIERECRLESEDDLQVVLGAWLCSSDRARCD
jgi:hypothetical protein